MSPRYESYIPDGQEAKYEAFVASLGGSSALVGMASEDYMSVWTLQVGKASSDVASVGSRFESDTSSVKPRYVRLISDICKLYTCTKTPSFDLDLSISVVIESLQQLVQEKEIPNTVYARSHDGKISFARMGGGPLPKDISVFIDAYGLADGEKKTIKRVAENTNRSISTVTNSIYKVSGKLYRKLVEIGQLEDSPREEMPNDPITAAYLDSSDEEEVGPLAKIILEALKKQNL